jgi:ribosomal subunit interface protein
VDIVVKGRRAEVTDRFRGQVSEKLGKVERLAPKVMRVEVELTHEPNPRRVDQSQRVELTCLSKGPVIRAEAAANDAYAALDLAWTRLEQRLRRAADRRRVHYGARTPVSVAAATAAATATTAPPPEPRSVETEPPSFGTEPPAGAGSPGARIDGEGPMVIREKVHAAAPMTLDQALYEMELVGHDFFLFVDEASSLPSVVYRRCGYDYGVIRLDVTEPVRE